MEEARKFMSTRSRIANAVYYLAIFMLIVFAGVIVFKLMFWPPCTQSGHDCVVDGWSVAGLAATVLGISATLLALLGTFAVAAWWTGLDDKIDNRVTSQIKEDLKEKEDNINAHVNDLLIGQESKIKQNFDKNLNEQLDIQEKELIDRMNKKFNPLGMIFDKEFLTPIQAITKLNTLEKEVSALRQIASNLFATIPPWMIEFWALNAVKKQNDGSIAEIMVKRYLEYVDGFLSDDPSKISQYIALLTELNAPSSDLLYFWDAALRWQKIVDQSQKPEIIKRVDENINLYKPKVNAWKQPK